MCPACVNGLHIECFEPIATEDDSGKADCCCWKSQEVVVIGGSTEPGSTDEDSPAPREKIRDIPVDDRGNESLRDPDSTGRKRAARLKPILDGMVCEWANLRFAGGGPIPIIGCRGTVLVGAKGNSVNTGNIHHGPDKSVLLNTDGNLHRICSQCHNRWHELNDPLYPAERPPFGGAFVPLAEEEVTPHDKYSLASDEEMQYSDAWWGLPPAVRETLPFRKELT